MSHPQGHPLQDFAIAITLLTAYACLHPFSGWLEIGVGPLAYLTAPWPRYFTWGDIWLNVLGFMPFGFAWMLLRRNPTHPLRRVFCVWLAGTLLSFAIETTQNYLPTRVASNIDLATNSAGALLGALAGLQWGRWFDTGSALASWRAWRILPGRRGSLGLLLIGLWWFSLLNPSSYLFANGDLHPLLDTASNYPLSGNGFLRVETALASANLLAVGLFARRVMKHPSLLQVAVALLVGLAVKSLASWVFLAPHDPLHWATPGGLRGLAIGSAMLLLCWHLPARLRHALASLALLAATALVNMAPDNPYWDAATRLTHQGHVLNFHGATQLMACLWPFLTLLWLTLSGPLQRLPEEVE